MVNATEFRLPIRHHTIRDPCGDVWQRERLDRKTARPQDRSPATVAELIDKPRSSPSDTP